MLSLFKAKKTVPRLRRPAQVSIIPQKLGLDYRQGLAPNFYANNVFLSAMFQALSAQFPAGERFLIASVRMFQPYITDEALAQDARGFIGQEAHHAKEHEALNQALKAIGIPTDHIERNTQWLIDNISTHLSPENQMAATAALEHFTAMLGSLVLSNPSLFEEVHPSFRALFIWHAIEESEHKAVAFDVYQNTIGSYPRLMAAYLWTSSLLMLLTSYYTCRILIRNGGITNMRHLREALAWMFGLGKGKGHFRRMLPQYFSFFRPHYHPWEEDNSADIIYWKQVLKELLEEPQGSAAK